MFRKSREQEAKEKAERERERIQVVVDSLSREEDIKLNLHVTTLQCEQASLEIEKLEKEFQRKKNELDRQYQPAIDKLYAQRNPLNEKCRLIENLVNDIKWLKLRNYYQSAPNDDQRFSILVDLARMRTGPNITFRMKDGRYMTDLTPFGCRSICSFVDINGNFGRYSVMGTESRYDTYFNLLTAPCSQWPHFFG